MYFDSFEEPCNFCQISDFSIYPPIQNFTKKLPNSSQGVICGRTDVTQQGNFLQMCLNMVNFPN